MPGLTNVIFFPHSWALLPWFISVRRCFRVLEGRRGCSPKRWAGGRRASHGHLPRWYKKLSPRFRIQQDHCHCRWRKANHIESKPCLELVGWPRRLWPGSITCNAAFNDVFAPLARQAPKVLVKAASSSLQAASNSPMLQLEKCTEVILHYTTAT